VVAQWYLLRYHCGMKPGPLIRSARGSSGLTLRALAERAGTSHATLAAYEQGHKVPRADTLLRILEAAGTELVPAPLRRADRSPEARRAKGDELVQALRLAQQFPARRADHPGYPRFGRAA
jgi:transcriptional regulator with XRE-family HTH domain